MNDRKQEVILAAQHLFMEKGFTATSIQDILDASNISKGTFYNYFSSKNECLIAILEHGHDEITIRRRALLSEASPADKNILIEQISIRSLVTDEHNLVPLVQTVFHSGDPELKTLIRNQHLEELAWLSHRLMDVYGSHIKPYASDCAVMIHGIMQHMLQAWKASNKEVIAIVELIAYTMRIIDRVLPEMVRHGDHFLNEHHFFNYQQERQDKHLTKKQLLTQLTDIHQQSANKEMDENHQYLSFLIEEIQAEAPRVFLLETVIHAFRESFIGTTFDHQADEIALNLWIYLDSINSK